MSSPKLRTVTLLWSSSLMLNAYACGADTEDHRGRGGTGGSAGIWGNAGGSAGGTASTEGSAGVAGSAGAAGANTTLTCGTNTCRSALGLVQVCCAGDGTRCGVDSSALTGLPSCQELNSPGVRDTTCDLPGRGGLSLGSFCVPLQGCRKPDDTCGFLLNVPLVLSLGCVVLPPGSIGALPPCTPGDAGARDAALSDAADAGGPDASDAAGDAAGPARDASGE